MNFDDRFLGLMSMLGGMGGNQNNGQNQGMNLDGLMKLMGLMQGFGGQKTTAQNVNVGQNSGLDFLKLLPLLTAMKGGNPFNMQNVNMQSVSDNIAYDNTTDKTDNIRTNSKEGKMEKYETLREKKGFICDMDGVLYHGNKLLPGVAEFVQWLKDEQKDFLFLTNNSGCTPRELQQKLARMGIEVSEDNFYTSALASAAFLKEQAPGCSAYVRLG